MTVSDPLNRARESHFLFFSSKDIQSLLVEVAGDIEQAVTRITEGASSFRFFSIFLISFQVLPNSGLSHAKRTRNILPLHTLPKTQLPFVAIPVAEEVVAVVAVGLGEVALQAEVVAVQAEAVQPMGIYPGRERPVQHPLHLQLMLLRPVSRWKRHLRKCLAINLRRPTGGRTSRMQPMGAGDGARKRMLRALSRNPISRLLH